MKYENITTADYEQTIKGLAASIYREYKQSDTRSIQRACEAVYNELGYTVAKPKSILNGQPCLNETRRSKLYTALNNMLGREEFVARTKASTPPRKIKYTRVTTQKQEMLQAIDSRLDKKINEINRLQSEIRLLKKQRSVVKTMKEVV
jgi:hypothetical protein